MIVIDGKKAMQRKKMSYATGLKMSEHEWHTWRALEKKDS